MTLRPRLLAAVLWLSLTLTAALPGCAPSPEQPSAGPGAPPASVAPATAAATPVFTPSPVAATPQATSTAVATVTPVATTAFSPTRSATPAAPAFSGSAAYAHVDYLAGRIGSRPGGSQAFADAASYIGSNLQQSGYTVQAQQYQVNTFREASTRFVLSRPIEVEVAARALVYSGGGSVEGTLAYGGLGRPSDIPAGVQGKILLLDRGEITFQSKVDNALSRGVAAVVIANDRAGEFGATLARPVNAPVVSILQVDGQKLLEFVRQGPTTVSLTVNATNTTRPGQNVVATRATVPSRRQVILGAHYDSVAAGPGANDNGSGVATLLELARAVSGRTFAFDLAFVAFGDEEIGLVGSKKYLEGLSQQDRLRTVAMINFDMVGVGGVMEFGGDQALAARTIQIAQKLGYRTQPVSLRPGQSSDHASFTEAGIPSVFFYRADDPNYHSSLDTADRVKPDNLEAAGNVALAFLDALSRGN